MMYSPPRKRFPLFMLWPLLFCRFSRDIQFIVSAIPTTGSLALKNEGTVQDISRGYLEDFTGQQYSLADLVPHDSVNLPTAASFNDFPLVYKATFDDGVTVLAQKDDRGNIIYIELAGKDRQPVQYFMKTQECSEEELYTFSVNQVIDPIFVGSFFGDHEAPSTTVADDFDGLLRVQANTETGIGTNLPEHVYTPDDRSSAECTYFRVINVAIVYDAEFCRKFDGKTGAQSRITMIVAAASLLYENDMCVKLQLANIVTPDDGCLASNTFASMPRYKACDGGAASETFIRYFADWMRKNRDSFGLDRDVLVHAFTGVPPSGTLGCAYIGTFCRNKAWAYGLNYTSSDFLSIQATIFAHELAHNLNASHLSVEQASGKAYIMRTSLQNPNIGFSERTIQSILGFLDSPDITCDEVAFPNVTNAPTLAPIPPTTFTPTEDAPSPTVPSPSCRVRLSENPDICLSPSRGGVFGCFELEKLVRVQQNEFCTNPDGVRVSLRSCEFHQDVRHLRGKKPNAGALYSYSQDDETSKAGGPNFEDAVMSLPSETVPVGESKNDGLPSFVADDCGTIACRRVNNHNCLATDLDQGQDERIFDLSILAVAEGGGADFLLVQVSVSRSNSRRCLIPGTVCLE